MIILATVAGALGAVGRYLLGGFVQERTKSDLPIGTLVVNLTGALLLGVVVGIDDLQSTVTIVAAGFLSGFTTFSTWMIETVRLGVPPLSNKAFLNLVVTFTVGVGLAAAGYGLST